MTFLRYNWMGRGLLFYSVIKSTPLNAIAMFHSPTMIISRIVGLSVKFDQKIQWTLKRYDL